MKKTHSIMLLGVAMASASGLWAQSGPVAAGGNGSGSGGSVSYSIGQIDYIHSSSGGGYVGQGLQQPFEIYIVTGIEETGINLFANLYPNPARESVTLEISEGDMGNMSYQLTDIAGKEIGSGTIRSASTLIDLDGLAQAAYLLRITRNQQPVKTFRILKSN